MISLFYEEFKKLLFDAGNDRGSAESSGRKRCYGAISAVYRQVRIISPYKSNVFTLTDINLLDYMNKSLFFYFESFFNLICIKFAHLSHKNQRRLAFKYPHSKNTQNIYRMNSSLQDIQSDIARLASQQSQIQQQQQQQQQQAQLQQQQVQYQQQQQQLQQQAKELFQQQQQANELLQQQQQAKELLQQQQQAKDLLQQQQQKDLYQQQQAKELLQQQQAKELFQQQQASQMYQQQMPQSPYQQQYQQNIPQLVSLFIYTTLSA